MIEPAYMDLLTFEPKGHIYRFEGEIVPHITGVVPSDYSHVNEKILERARQRGSIVHKMTELHDLGTLDYTTIDPKLMPYLEAWIIVREEYEIEFEPKDVERRLYHPLYKYAGTGDRPRAWIKPPGFNQRRRLATIELKTIAKMTEEVGLQTAAQMAAENYRARELGIPEVEERWGVKLGSGRKGEPLKKVIPYTKPTDLKVFLSYLTCLRWEVANKRRTLTRAA